MIVVSSSKQKVVVSNLQKSGNGTVFSSTNEASGDLSTIKRFRGKKVKKKKKTIYLIRTKGMFANTTNSFQNHFFSKVGEREVASNSSKTREKFLKISNSRSCF